MILLSMILPILRRRFVAENWALRDDGPAMKPVWSTIKKHPIADLVLFSKRAECVICSPRMPPRLAGRGPGVPTPVWFVLPVNSVEWAWHSGLGTFSARTRRIYRLRPNLLSKEAACRLPSDDKCGNMWRRQTVQSPNAGRLCSGPRAITNSFRPHHKVSLPECQSSSPSTVIKPSCSPVHRPVEILQRSTANCRAAATTHFLRALLLVAACTAWRGL